MGYLLLETSGPHTLAELLEAEGEIPLPPYIVRARSARGEATDRNIDRQRYQTVYAEHPVHLQHQQRGSTSTNRSLMSWNPGESKLWTSILT